MPNAAVDTDVLIVGAGPVGLFLANECARRGLRWRLIETRAAQSEHSKALAIFPRTMEIFDMAGLVGPFLEAANRVTSVSVMTPGRRLAQMRFTPEESPYPFVAMVPQDVTERLLADAVGRRGGAVEYEMAFVTAAEQDDRVNVTLERTGERTGERKGEAIHLKTSFVVGCDGAHSAVRHLLKLPFEGAEYEETFLLADVETNDALPADELQLCPSDLGPVAIFPMSPTRRRVVAIVAKPEGDAPSLELVRKLLAQRAPSGMEARALHWSSYFHIQHRQAAKLREGRFFLAGDAAHIHSPFGGQGMNTGLHDAWNLIWKLDFVLHGRGGEELLDSYGAERLPVIRHVIEITDLLTRAMATPNKLAQLLRDAVIPMVSQFAPFQHAFVQRLSELDVAYRGSPIVEGAGERYFDDSLRGGDGIGSRFLLLLDGKADPADWEDARQLAESFKDTIELRLRPGKEITLVRPDGYIAYSTHGRNRKAGLRAVRWLLRRQTSPSPQYPFRPRTAA